MTGDGATVDRRYHGSVAAPVYLRSIDVTLHDLGEIYRGPFSHQYWSNKGCLYHHAYPVGYRATKPQFGRLYEMTIEAGEVGPVFKVGGLIRPDRVRLVEPVGTPSGLLGSGKTAV